MRQIFLLIVSLFAGAYMSLCAQEAGEISLSNVQVGQEGNRITVQYNLSFGERVNSCRIELYMSMDGGNSFSSKPIKEGLSGDFDKITSDGLKTIVFDASSIKEKIAGKHLVFKVNVASKDVSKEPRSTRQTSPAVVAYPQNFVVPADRKKYLIEADIAVTPQLSYGIMLGSVKNFGWYLKGRSSFNFRTTAYECKSDGSTSSGGSIWTSGEFQKARLVVSGGILMKINNCLYPYVGAGYGVRSVLWNDTVGNWVKVSDYSCAGLSIDAGVVMNFGKFAISAGVTNTALKYTEVELGIGVMF